MEVYLCGSCEERVSGRGRGRVRRRDDLRAWERMMGEMRFVRSNVRQKSSFELLSPMYQRSVMFCSKEVSIYRHEGIGKR